MNQKEVFGQILDQGLDRLFKGESINQIVADYPDQAKELEPLLRTAAAGRLFSKLQPRADFKSRARFEFMSAAREWEEQRQGRSWFNWLRQPAWAISLTVVVLIVLGTGGSVLASNSAMPGDFLYSVKLATEKVRLTLTTSDVTKTELNAEFANRRTLEIEYLATAGNPEQIQTATARLNSNLSNINVLVQASNPVSNSSDSGSRNAQIFTTQTASNGGAAQAPQAPVSGGGASPASSAVKGPEFSQSAIEISPVETFTLAPVPSPTLAPVPGPAMTPPTGLSIGAANPTNAVPVTGSGPNLSVANTPVTYGNSQSNVNSKLTKNEHLQQIIEDNYLLRQAHLEAALEKAKPELRPAIKQALADSEAEYRNSLQNLAQNSSSNSK